MEENAEKRSVAEIEPIVKEALDMYRPGLQADGGDAEFVEIDGDYNVHLRLVGACGACPYATMTLKNGIEQYIQDACPEVNSVVNDNEMAL